MTSSGARLARRLADSKLAYSTRPLEFGRIFTFEDGVHFTLYDTGRCQWQGTEPEPRLRKKVERLAERSRGRRGPTSGEIFE